MIKTILIDDEPMSVSSLQNMLGTYCLDINVVGKAHTVEGGIALIKEEKPDLVFLDIEFPNASGFDLLKAFENINFEVIFVTGFEQYAIQAFKTAALDYLLKPIDIDELEEAVAKVREKRNGGKNNKNIDVLLQNWKSQGNHKIALSNSDGFNFVKTKDILYCKGDGAYTHFMIKGGERIMVSKNLKEFEGLLTPFSFFRVHKSYLVNLNEIKRYKRGDGGHIIMSDGALINVSKRKKEGFLNNLSKV